MGKRINLHRSTRATALAIAMLGTMGFAIGNSGSQTPPPACPRISCPPTAPGSPVVFRVDGAPAGTTFSWTVSTGSILGPSNRRQLRVGAIPQGPCEATVRLTHIPEGCRSELPCKTIVGQPPPNRPPSVSIVQPPSTIILPCPEGRFSKSCPTAANMALSISAVAEDTDNDVLTYEWTSAGGRVTGNGKNVVWDLSGAQAGHYSLTVAVSDGESTTVSDSVSIDIRNCDDCRPCPTVSITRPSSVVAGQPVTFTANLNEPTDASYKWVVSLGTITKGQGTSSIMVDTSDLAGKTVTATVALQGVGTCQIFSSGSTVVASQAEVRSNASRQRRASYFTRP